MVAKASILNGIIRKPRFRGGENPVPHSPLLMRNRVCMEVIGPDHEVKQQLTHEGNILQTYGLNRLIEMLASDAGGASAWMNYIGVGNSTSTANSTQNGLIGTFGTGTVGGATANKSDAGNLTIAYQATFVDTGNARTINEVALCQTNTYDASGGARTVLGASVNKQTGDTVNITYEVIAGTA